MDDKVRFLQISDVHLASTFSTLDAGLRAEMREEQWRVFEHAVGLAKERSVDLVLIAGDLFEAENSSGDAVRRISRILGAIAPIPVFVTPGNHDRYTASAWFLDAWPENVTLFKSGKWETVATDSFSVASIAYISDANLGKLLAETRPPSDGRAHFLSVHGSRMNQRQTKARGDYVFQFSDADILAAGFDYAAIGHYHSHARILDDVGRVRGAYAGCAQGRGFDELGDKGVLIGEVDAAAERPRGAALEFIPTSRRRFFSWDVDVTDAADDDKALQACHSQEPPEAGKQDFVRIALCGRAAYEVDAAVLRDAMLNSFAYVEVNADSLMKRNDLEAISREGDTPRAYLARTVIERLSRAQTDDERARIRRAVDLALDALSREG
jgi:DNA repair exonuclease SbcCD nuclease subunit